MNIIRFLQETKRYASIAERYSAKNQHKRNTNATKREKNHILSGELESEPESPQPTKSKDVTKARKDFWSVQGDFTYRHHNEPRVQLHEPKEESFPNPLKYIDVTRATDTNLDVLQEKRTHHSVNVDANRFLDRIHKVHIIGRETSKRTYVVREETEKKSSNNQT